MSDLSAPKVLEDLIQQAERANASDIHLQKCAGATQVAFRLDGIVSPVSDLPAELADHVFGRIKFLARLKTYQDSLPQDGRIDKADGGGRHDIRVATYPTVTGEKIVLRLFSDFTAPTLHELSFPEAICAELEAFLRQTAGLLLLTGQPVAVRRRPFTPACGSFSIWAAATSLPLKILSSRSLPA